MIGQLGRVICARVGVVGDLGKLDGAYVVIAFVRLKLPGGRQAQVVGRLLKRAIKQHLGCHAALHVLRHHLDKRRHHARADGMEDVPGVDVDRGWLLAGERQADGKGKRAKNTGKAHKVETPRL